MRIKLSTKYTPEGKVTEYLKVNYKADDVCCLRIGVFMVLFIAFLLILIISMAYKYEPIIKLLNYSWTVLAVIVVSIFLTSIILSPIIAYIILLFNAKIDKEIIKIEDITKSNLRNIGYSKSIIDKVSKEVDDELSRWTN